MIETEKLRSRILSLAMRGELSERKLKDGSAAELYLKILETKAELIKSGRIRKDKQYDAIEAGNMPYSIPDNWCWVRFGKIINLQSGQDLKPSEYNDKQSGIPYITGASNYESDGSIIINRWTDCPKAYAYEDDILLSCKGTVGKLTILREKEVHIARQIMGIRTFDVDVTFMFYYLQSMIYGIKEAQKGLIPGIERNDVLNLLCPLPPVSEQVRIVEKIEALFCELDKIDVLQNQYTFNQEALKSKLIDAAIQGKLTEQLPEDGTAEELYQGIQKEKQTLIKAGMIKKDKALPDISENEIPFDIPANWKWVRVNDIGSWSAGATPSRSNPSYYANGTIPWIKTGELNDGVIADAEEYITETAFKECSVRLNPVGSVLIAMYGATIGKVAILDIEATTNQACCACIPIKIDNKYLFYFLKNNKRTFLAASHGGAQPNISKDIITKSLMPLPPLAEQQRIAKKIDDVLYAINMAD